MLFVINKIIIRPVVCHGSETWVYRRTLLKQQLYFEEKI